MIMRVLLAFTFFLLHKGDAGDCAARWYPGKDSPVCVCTCDYCDSIEPIGNVDDKTVVKYVTTQSGSRLKRSTAKKVLPKLPVLQVLTCLLDTSTKFQTINGFGGTINDNAAYNIKSLDQVTCSSGTLRDVLMREYYSADGARFTLMRCPISSNDGSDRLYTYADTPEDYELVHFGLQPEDTDRKIPIIQQAQSLSSEALRIVASSWSAPAWMKRCNNLTGSSNGANDVPFQRMLKGNPCNSSEDSKYYQTWANYLVKFLKAYKDQNISIWAMTTQNEPVSSHIVQWQSQVYYSWTERDFIKCHLGPAMNESGLDTKLFIFDDSRYPWIEAWVAQICNDPEARQYVDGVALHWFLDGLTPPQLVDHLQTLCGEHIEVMNTEAYGYSLFLLFAFGVLPEPTQGPSFGQWQNAPDHAKGIISDLNHNFTGWIEWALATDTVGEPQWTGTIDSAVIVNASGGEFLKQPLYYAVTHFSHFIPRGSQRIGLTFQQLLPYDLPACAFLRPDGLKVVVVVNDNGHDVILSLVTAVGSLTGQTIPLNLTPNSITTAIFR